jgi:hypothetical protein
MSTAERRSDPQIPGKADSGVLSSAAGVNTWQQVALKLRQLGSSREHEDDVQETLLRLLRRLGPEPSPEVAVKLGGVVIFGLRVDRSRRPAEQLLGERDALLAAGELDHKEPQPPDVQRLDPSLATALGRKGANLLNELLAGRASNKELARRMRTSSAAVRRRRARILRILAQWLRDVEDLPE